VLLAAAGILLLSFSQRSVTRTAGGPLLDISPSEAERIVIREGSASLTLEKTNGLWKLEGNGFADRADPRAIRSLLETAASLAPLDVLAAGEPATRGKGLEALGLQNPKRSVTIRAGGTHTLHFGADAAAKGRLYARLDSGKTIYLVPDDLVSIAFRPPQDFRDPRLTALLADNLEEVSLSRGGSPAELRVARGPAGWHLASPVNAGADQRAVEQWVGGILSARIDRWMPAETDAGSCGLDVPRATFTLRPRANTPPITISVGSPVPGPGDLVFARCGDRSGICCVAGLGNALAQDPASLRTRRPSAVEYDAVDRIEIGGSDGALLVMNRKPGTENWQIRDDASGAEIPGGRVAGWFSELQGLSAIRFEAATPEHIRNRGLDRPSTVRLIAHLSENTAEEGAGEVVLQEYGFGTASDGEVALLQKNSSDLLVLPDTSLSILRTTKEDWAPSSEPPRTSPPAQP
jgi:hypothetical protein